MNNNSSNAGLSFDVSSVREDFPILKRQVNGKDWVYLDNAASTQKPNSVIQKMLEVDSKQYSNVHRGVHTVSQEATDLFEAARRNIQTFTNAESDSQIILTKGVTESINLVAQCYGDEFVHEGDEVIISSIEHHSNIVPWQILCQRKKAELKVIPVLDDGSLDLDAYSNLLSDKTKIVSITHISNTLGTVNPLESMISMAHEKGIPVFVDGAQGAPHSSIDVQKLDCDFYGFSSHKMFGPTGVGVLYGKKKWLDAMPPYQSGGNMIKTVSFENTTFADIPGKFEAGTPNITSVIGLSEAIDYLNKLPETRHAYEESLLNYATEKLLNIDGLRIIGTAPNKTSIISFNIEGVHPYDLGLLLDKQGIAVRTGHHCCQPLMKRFDIPGTARASFTFYNTLEEVDKLTTGIEFALNMLR